MQKWQRQPNDGWKSGYCDSLGILRGASLEPSRPKRRTRQEERWEATLLWLGLMNENELCQTSDWIVNNTVQMERFVRKVSVTT